jgi:hypothetical protein
MSVPGVSKGAAFAALFLFGVSFVPGAAARTRCAYASAPKNLLTVKVRGDALAAIRRDGQEIFVLGGSMRRPRPCSGGVPTVLNTDTIRVAFGGSLHSPIWDWVAVRSPRAPRQRPREAPR